jgi:hypothetical protein
MLCDERTGLFLNYAATAVSYSFAACRLDDLQAISIEEYCEMKRLTDDAQRQCQNARRRFREYSEQRGNPVSN